MVESKEIVMLETYITPILMSYVDKYIKNLKPSDLNLSLWGGDVSLTNLELNLHALEKVRDACGFLDGIACSRRLTLQLPSS